MHRRVKAPRETKSGWQIGGRQKKQKNGQKSSQEFTFWLVAKCNGPAIPDGGLIH
jgi:hypothetical protein